MSDPRSRARRLGNGSEAERDCPRDRPASRTSRVKLCDAPPLTGRYVVPRRINLGGGSTRLRVIVPDWLRAHLRPERSGGECKARRYGLARSCVFSESTWVGICPGNGLPESTSFRRESTPRDSRPLPHTSSCGRTFSNAQ